MEEVSRQLGFVMDMHELWVQCAELWALYAEVSTEEVSTQLGFVMDMQHHIQGKSCADKCRFLQLHDRWKQAKMQSVLCCNMLS